MRQNIRPESITWAGGRGGGGQRAYLEECRVMHVGVFTGPGYTENSLSNYS